MKTIDLNHWGVIDNEASISLSRLHASFNVLMKDRYPYFQLTVTDSNMENITLNFYTLEDVFAFTEDVVRKCYSNEEVLNKYQEMGKNGLFKLPGGVNPPKEDAITLSPAEVSKIIVDYFASNKKYNISIEVKGLYLDYNGQRQVYLYLIEHLNYGGIKKDNRYILTKGDIQNVLSEYVNDCGYELVDFNYISDSSNYGGITLNVKQKDSGYQKKYQIKNY